MPQATFSFCCPYRTRKWHKLPIVYRRVLMQLSRPVLQQMLDDCAPRCVIVAGVGTVGVFKATAGVPLESGPIVAAGPYAKGTYQWRAAHVSWRGRVLLLVQVPHFSRANDHKKLDACGAWLSDLVAQ